jgi:hypothetical protein
VEAAKHKSARKAGHGRLWFLALGAVAFVAGFHGFWLERSLEEDRSYRGYFEPSEGRVGLVFSKGTQNTGLKFPAPGLLDDGRYVVAPGTVVAMPVSDLVEYHVTGALSGLAPYVVVGELASGQPSCGASDEYCIPGGIPLRSAMHLVPTVQGAAFVEWQADRPWHTDEEWLRSLASACEGSDRLDVVVARRSDRVTVRVEHCEAVLEHAGENTVFAVLGGPSVSLVHTVPSVLRFRSRITPYRLVTTAAFGALAGIAVRGVFGAVGSVSLVLAVLGLSMWNLVVARTTTLILSVGILCTRVVLLFVERVARVGVFARAGILLIMLLVFAAGAFIFARQRPAPVPRGSPPNEPACFVTGYSAAHGEGMREAHSGRFDPIGGMNDRLNRSCPVCAQRTMTTAEGGETFAFVRDAVCAPSRLRRDGVVIFLGGANDDMLGWRDSLLPPARAAEGLLLAVLSFSRSDFDAEKLNAVQEESINLSLASLPTHLDEVREAVLCARSRGHRFIFLNDFVVMDLPRGRSAPRARIMEERRRVVEEAGGTFIDLLDVIGQGAGVSWFDDFVHPAMDVHRQIAELVCTRLSTAEPSSAAPQSEWSAKGHRPPQQRSEAP